MRYILLVLFGILLSVGLSAQERPYFQQRANYVINVALDDTLHQLVANETITYFNQSPDTLTKIYIHLWPNGYRDRNTAMSKQLEEMGNTDFYFSKDKQRGYIDQLDFKINGQPISYRNYQNQADIAEIVLNEPLLPSDSMVIETPFHVKIPGDFSRLGHQDQAYQITQWYPKMAVYDRHGWQMFPYLNIGEFYGDFGSFDVKITLPENYYVASTGVLVDNKKEEDRIEKRIFDSKNGNFEPFNYFPKSSRINKTLVFHQDSIHDFAWFADKRFLIAKKEVFLPRSNKKVDAYAYYLPDTTSRWERVPASISRTLIFYSEKLGDYPYAQCTAVEGALKAGGGMEYPMITVISACSERVVMHEVGHNWFYGILAFNERKYPWLDEGFNSYYEYEYMQHYHPASTFLLDLDFRSTFHSQDYPEFYNPYFLHQFTHSHFDYQPIGLTSEKYSMANYGVSVYFTPIAMLRYLKDYLGEEQFDLIMLQFASEWRFKHPLPSDIKRFFEEKSGKNLDWFFDTLINTNKSIDMQLSSLKPLKGDRDQYLVKTKDISRLATPFTISVLDKVGNVLSKKWVEPIGRSQTDTVFIPALAYKVAINHQLTIPEVDKRDNEMRIHGLFRKEKMPCFSFLWRVSDPAKTSVLYTPVFGWNYNNGWMLGVAVYSDPIVPPKFDYLLMPMYSFGAKSIAGSADVGYSFAIPSLNIKKIRFGLFAKQYAYDFFGDINQLKKVQPSIQLVFNTPATQNIDHQLLLRNVYICQTTLDENGMANDWFGKQTEYSILNLHYRYKNERKVNPWSADADAQLKGETVKFSAEIKTQYTYAKKKGIDLRVFWGKIANPSNDFFPNMNINASGIKADGMLSSDYLFDHTLMGRSEYKGFLYHQMIGNDGGFVTPTPLGQTNDWLLAVNLRMNVPGKLPLRLFGNIATFSNANEVLENNEVFIYEAGVTLIFFRNIAEISVPLFISKDMQRVMDLNNKKYYERIRFILNLDAINPFKVVKKYKQLM
jgi:hypothetical protein